ncbi:MAG: phage capsid protein [Chitinispirillia bacterium]|nr:phage capsid protein [Chitinispirillia bacterium]MCL2268597.1 phage capsid protein [Chitinispirillia bacterium]
MSTEKKVEFSGAAVAPFPVDPVLTAIAVAYRNEKLIADEVLPLVPVGKQNFKYRVFEAKDSFTVPDTLVGRKGLVSEVEFGYTEKDGSTEGHGLEEAIPKDDIDNAPEGYDPVARATVSTTDLVLLGREVRTANLVFNAASYGAKNKITLAGANQFTNPDSDPIKVVLSALDACIMRPNIMVIGHGAWTALRTNPKIVKAAHGNAGDSGTASRQQVAELFELDKILVGSGWVNTEAKGQEMAQKRIWGNHIALIYQNAMPDVNGKVSFGVTAQFGERFVTSGFDSKIGLEGGTRIRVGMRVRELITANDLGYFIQNAAA